MSGSMGMESLIVQRKAAAVDGGIERCLWGRRLGSPQSNHGFVLISCYPIHILKMRHQKIGHRHHYTHTFIHWWTAGHSYIVCICGR